MKLLGFHIQRFWFSRAPETIQMLYIDYNWNKIFFLSSALKNFPLSPCGLVYFCIVATSLDTGHLSCAFFIAESHCCHSRFYKSAFDTTEVEFRHHLPVKQLLTFLSCLPSSLLPLPLPLPHPLALPYPQVRIRGGGACC